MVLKPSCNLFVSIHGCDDIASEQCKEGAVVTRFDELRFCGTPPSVIVEALDVHIGLDIISSWFDIFWDYLFSWQLPALGISATRRAACNENEEFLIDKLIKMSDFNLYGAELWENKVIWQILYCNANISCEKGDSVENPVMSFHSKNNNMFSLQVMHSIVIFWHSFSQEIFTYSSLRI